MADADGVAAVDLVLPFNSMFGGDDVSLLGRTVVIHENEDDLGKGEGELKAGSL